MNALERFGHAGCTRRRFLTGTAAVSAGALFGLPRTAGADAPPETRKVRIAWLPATCLAPLMLAEEALRLEGFTDVEYIKAGAEPGPNLVADGHADFTQWDVAATLPLIDAGKPISLLAGMHPGCQELIASDRVRAIRDLKGKRIAITATGNADHINVASILAYVGIDPRTEVTWVAGSEIMDSMKLFTDGQADAFFAFAPQPQELRRRKIGHTIVSTLTDKPWSQYFCCTFIGNRDFVRAYPAATKRALRAMLKSADTCAADPERAARFLNVKGHEPRYDIALEVMKMLPYRRWRDVDPEDTLRFHALRLHEVGMIKSTPQKLIAQGTDWRFLNELKKELKA